MLARATINSFAGLDVAHRSPVAHPCYRASKAHLPVIPLATQSHQVVFAYDHVIIPHCSHPPLGGISRESLGPTTGGFACNSQVPEAWTTEASGQKLFMYHMVYQSEAIFFNCHQCHWMSQHNDIFTNQRWNYWCNEGT